MAQQALALVRKHYSTSGTIITPLKTTLSGSRLRKAVRILSHRMPKGFQNFWPIRLYGRWPGTPLFCPTCGRTASQLIKEEGIRYVMSTSQRKSFLIDHLARAH